MSSASASASTRATAAQCLHCGSPVPADSARADFCCAGCEAVHGLLKAQGLERYYALAGRDVAPVSDAPRGRSHAWLEPLIEKAEGGTAEVCALELDVQGIHCAACVWLMNELFRRQTGGGGRVIVNPALGKVKLQWRRGRFDAQRYVRDVESFGYQFGPSRKEATRASVDLPVRLGITAAITMNVMIFSVSFYLGLTPAEGELFSLFTQLSLWLSAVVVVVGGWPFFKAAVQGLRRGVLHLDLPIAVGILLVFATSVLQARDGRGDLAYFDTLNTFVLLMLVGRWLQQRVVERNRRFLLEDDGAAGLYVRRVEAGRLQTVPAAAIREGDELLVAPGDLVPVDGALLEGGGRFSTAWITGESDVRTHAEGEEVPAGACNEGQKAARVRARTAFADSPLVALLRAPPDDRGARVSRFWDVLARGWVVGVFAAAAVGVFLWWPEGPHRSLEVAAALLVVTCPCALGIATPLAYELMQSRLRRSGVFVRSLDLLDRATRVRKVLFDKTGTLTLGRLELADRRSVEALPAEVRDLAFSMAARSNHPVSRALADALSQMGARFEALADVEELPGRGLELRRDGAVWRLGKAQWASGAQGTAGVTVLTRNGEELTRFELREALRPDARREVETLNALGLQTWLVSGDAQAKVSRLAEELGIPLERALGGQRPEDKAAAVARVEERDTLFLGDGVNDSLAFEAALCAGTPAVDRPVMPGRADFFLLGEGVNGVRELLEGAQRLRRVVRRVLFVTVLYNALAVGACLAGWMTPLRAAVAMPASSLTAIASVAISLGGRRRDGRGGRGLPNAEDALIARALKTPGGTAVGTAAAQEASA